jgi:hypothetical protein
MNRLAHVQNTRGQGIFWKAHKTPTSARPRFRVSQCDSNGPTILKGHGTKRENPYRLPSGWSAAGRSGLILSLAGAERRLKLEESVASTPRLPGTADFYPEFQNWPPKLISSAVEIDF